jgi:hypothetical protein
MLFATYIVDYLLAVWTDCSSFFTVAVILACSTADASNSNCLDLLRAVQWLLHFHLVGVFNEQQESTSSKIWCY